MNYPVNAPATLGGIELDSARAAIREWVRSGIADRADKVPRKRGIHRRRPTADRQAELASIIQQAVHETADAAFEDDPLRQRRFREAVLNGDRRDWPLVDGTDLEDLVDNARFWLARQQFLLKPGTRDIDLLPCLAPLCEHIIVDFGIRAERDRTGRSELRTHWTRFQEGELHRRSGGGRARLIRPLLAVGALAVIATLPVTMMDMLPRPGRITEDDPSNDSPTGERSRGDQDGTESPTMAETMGPTILETARTTCAPSADSVSVEDGGFTLIIKRAMAEEDPGIGGEELGCLFEALQIPASVVSRVQTTSSLSGLQDGEWDGFTAFWTFHVEEGLHMTISQLQD